MKTTASVITGPALGRCKGTKVKILDALIRQFGRPSGFLGSVAGFIMAHRPSNRDRNQWTVSLLDLQVEDRVLEVGFGPGVGIEAASGRAVRGLVAGIDHSQTMLRQAAKRNTAAIRKGRVDLRLAGVSDLPDFGRLFDKIFSANSVQFWPDPTRDLRRLRGLLKPGGRIAITFQPRNPGATPEDARRAGLLLVKNLETAGFSEIRLETRPTKPVPVVCALGANPVE